ncbi:Visual pigment-like receptor peropsin [Acropora cervicornis]|uniref:Visual pigment-like receptor peropsin n=1 Tax=Acropora cervicornis TaxID=6130 RepID=A0AAD9QST1_ACRCE|nr:Visual pigment-like receptor peropsin [Acropora cervicornis]
MWGRIYTMNNSKIAAPLTVTNSFQVNIISWCITYGLVATVIVVGNALIIGVFLQKQLPRQCRGYLIINLAIADLLVGTLALPMYIYIVYAFNYLPTNKNIEIFYHVYTVTDVFSGLASVFTLACIALERIYAVCSPIEFRYKATRQVYINVIIVVWIISGTAAVAYILSTPTVINVLPVKTFTFYLTGLSVLSVLVICSAYLAIALRFHFWKKYHMEMNASKQEMRLATVLFIITVVFVLTWSPFHIMNILVNFGDSFLYNIPVDIVYFTKLLHYGNSLANPAIYTLKIPEFRFAIRRMFCKNWVRETRV